MSETRPNSVPELFRCAVIGDSLAYGAGDEERKGIPLRLEEELRKRGISHPEVKNFGVNRSTTSDVLRRIEQERVRAATAVADAIVVSVGANDLLETPGGREAALRAPFKVADEILEKVYGVVLELRRHNPAARILLLGGYNPVPRHPFSFMIARYIDLWDTKLAARFRDDPLVSVVRMSDIITGPHRLSRFDNFHPGGAAYAEAASRIAEMLVGRRAA